MYSERRNVVLNLPYKLEITSSGGLALKDGETVLTATLINNKTGDEITGTTGSYTWERIESPDAFENVSNRSITIKPENLVEGIGTFKCTYHEEGNWWSVTGMITIAESIKGSDGISVESIVREYALGSSDKPPSEGWQPEQPERTDGTVIWVRDKITYTDGKTEYTEPYIGSGSDAPKVIIQYAWGKSPTIEPTNSLWMWLGKFFIWKNKFVGDSQGVWSEKRTEKPSKGIWYLWIRMSNDGGKTFDNAQCISDVSSSFEIQANPSFYRMTSRKYVKESQVIELTCIKTNYYGTAKPIWTLSNVDKICFTNETGSTIIEGLIYEGDRAFVLVQEECIATSFKITCSLEGFEGKELIIAGTYEQATSQYLGSVDATIGQDLPTKLEDGSPLMEGDMILYVYQDSYGVKHAQYMILADVANPSILGSWTIVISDSHHNAELMLSGIRDAIINGCDNAFVMLLVEKLVAQYIAAEFIRITGAIYGGSFLEDGTQEKGQDDRPGFHLSKYGVFQAVSAILKNIIAENGYFTGKFKSQGFETKDEISSISSSNIKEEYQDYWDSADTKLEEGTFIEYKVKTLSIEENYNIIAVSAYGNTIVFLMSGTGRDDCKIAISLDGGRTIRGYLDISGYSIGYDLLLEDDDTIYVPRDSNKFLKITNLTFQTSSTTITATITSINAPASSGINLFKLNNVYFYLPIVGSYYYSESIDSGSWTQLNNVESICYLNNTWYAINTGSYTTSFVLKKGQDLSSLYEVPISIPTLPSDWINIVGVSVNNNGVLCVLFSAHTTGSNTGGIYVLRCDNLNEGTLSFSLITIDSESNAYPKRNITYNNGLFMIVDMGKGIIWHSPDGLSWQSSTTYNSLISQYLLNTVSYARPIFGGYGYIVTGDHSVIIFPQFDNTYFVNFFLSVKDKLEDGIAVPSVEPLSYEHDVTANLIDGYGDEYQIAKMKISNDKTIYFTTSDGKELSYGIEELTYITLTNLVISAEQASIEITSMNPKDSVTDIGKESNRIRKLWSKEIDSPTITSETVITDSIEMKRSNDQKEGKIYIDSNGNVKWTQID